MWSRRSGRPLRSLWPGGSGFSLRAGRPGRALESLRALRAGRSLRSRWTLRPFRPHRALACSERYHESENCGGKPHRHLRIEYVEPGFSTSEKETAMEPYDAPTVYLIVSVQYVIP